MARPIIPVAVRRLADNGTLEVQSKGGQWIPWHLLSNASHQNVMVAFARDLSRHGGMMPTSAFWWTGGQSPLEQENEQRPDPEQEWRPYQDEQQTETQEQQTDDVVQDGGPEQQDTQDTDQHVQEDQQVQQDQQQDQMTTLEMLVRELARDEDDKARPSIMAEVNAMIQSFTRETPTDVGPTVRIEVKTPTQHVTKDGLFHSNFGDLLHLVSIGQHVFLPGPPGSGKSHVAEQVADVLGWKFAEISMSPDLPESRIWGGRTPDGFVETPLLEGLRYAMDNPDSGLVYLFDEMDAARASLVVSINSAAANCRVTAPNGDRLSWKDNVVFIGAANTFGTGPTAEFAGRNKLDAATLDRFAYIHWDTDPDMEAQVVRSFLYDDNARLADAWLDAWTTLRANVAAYGLKTFVTMRGARNGARMLASGMDIDKAMMFTIGNKLPADQWAKVSPL